METQKNTGKKYGKRIENALKIRRWEQTKNDAKTLREDYENIADHNRETHRKRSANLLSYQKKKTTDKKHVAKLYENDKKTSRKLSENG